MVANQLLIVANELRLCAPAIYETESHQILLEVCNRLIVVCNFYPYKASRDSFPHDSIVHVDAPLFASILSSAIYSGNPER